MRLTGLYPDRTRGGMRPRWVAVWSGETTRGKVAYHERLPFAVCDTRKEDAERYALEHVPEWSN